MLNKLRQLSIVHQTSVMLLIGTLFVFSFFTSFVAWSSNKALLTQAEDSLEKEVKLLKEMLRFYDQTLKQNTERLGDLFFSLFPYQLTIDKSETVQVGQYQAPLLLHAGETVNLNFETVDRFSEMTGGVATVFARYDDDFLRISTSLKKEDGGRAIGTLLGKSHPGYQGFLNGERYFGKANLFGKDYMTLYIPVKSGDGEVNAILFVGFDFSAGMTSLKEYIADIRFGESGYAFILDSVKGVLEQHPSDAGKKVVEFTDTTGNAIFKQMISQKTGVIRYPWAEGTGIKDKLVAFETFDDWNWVMAAGANIEELASEAIALRNILTGLSLLACGLLIFLIIAVLKYQLKPLQTIMQKLALIGEGDLTQTIDIAGFKVSPKQSDSKNEIRALSARINDMVGHFREVVEKISQSSANVTVASNQLQKISKKNHEGVQQQQSGADLLTGAIEKMLNSVKEVTDSAVSAADRTQEANGLAGEGREVMSASMNIIRQLASELEATATTVSNVEQDSNAIGTVLDVIRGIAEQTNLLALNAAIEAARAGEQGRGFAVVADEVRTLAQRSHESTQEIEDIILKLQAGTSKAVASIKHGKEQGETTVNTATRASESLEQIVRTVGSISEMNTRIANVAREQNAMASEINHNIVRMMDINAEAVENIQESSEAADRLSQLAVEMEICVEKFKV